MTDYFNISHRRNNIPTSCVQQNYMFSGSAVSAREDRVNPRLHDTTGCQPVVKPVWQPVVLCIQTFNQLSNPFDNPLYRVNKHPTGCQTGLTTGLATGCMFVYTIQPVVKSVVQPVVSCKRGFTDTQTHNITLRVDKSQHTRKQTVPKLQ